MTYMTTHLVNLKYGFRFFDIPQYPLTGRDYSPIRIPYAVDTVKWVKYLFCTKSNVQSVHIIHMRYLSHPDDSESAWLLAQQ